MCGSSSKSKSPASGAVADDTDHVIDLEGGRE
jgi:hypothetical protein